MSKILTNNQYYYQIADVIREQNGTNNTYKPPQMVNALKNLFYEEVEGVPPISFNGIGENLLDYRIDGASGGVGDRTSNLFDASNLIYGYTLNIETGLPAKFKTRCATIQPISINCNSLVLKFDTDISGVKFIYSLFNDDTFIRRVADKDSGETIDTAGANKIYISFYNSYSSSANLLPSDLKNIMLSENDNDYEPYGYKVPVAINGKNLFDENSEWNLFGSMSALGSNLVFPSNVGGNRKSYFFKAKPNTVYTISMSTVSDRLAIVEYTEDINPADATVSNKITSDNILLQISSSVPKSYSFTTSPNVKVVGVYYSLNTLPIDMQIEFGPSPTDYEEYHKLETVNIYLDEPIEENESISLSDTNVNIPTIRGTNVLSVDTEVQPSKVYVKVRKESSYETTMRERYEEQLSDIESTLQEV